jgi:septal ring factor EnvC (AmiA/AmiB activator)
MDAPVLDRQANGTEIFARLRNIEADVAAIKVMLQEWRRQQEDQEARLRKLEESEHKRRGGLALLAGMLTLASAAGAAAMKLLGN